MDRHQYLFLALAFLLGSAAIGLGSAHRAQQRAEEEPEALAGDDSDMTPLPRPAEADAPPPTTRIARSETLGPFQLRVRDDGRAALFSPGGDLVAEIDGFLGARLVTQAPLFGAPVVELTGRTCTEPCNPQVALLASRGDASFEVLRARGAPKLDDLDADGIPEVLLDHLMEGSTEVVTLPFRLEGGQYVPAYERFPDGVDRQLDALASAAERLCDEADDVSAECQGTLRALLGLAEFRAPGTALREVNALRMEPIAKSFARNEELHAEIEAEMKAVAGR